MRSIFIASLVALAIATTRDFDRSLEPNTEYHYKFDGLILSGLPNASSEYSQSRISARARVQAIDDHHVHLQLINIRMSASHMMEPEQMPALASMEQRELSDEYKKILELPVSAQFNDGLISEIQFEKKDAEWSKNMKRSVLNMLSFNPSAPLIEKTDKLFDEFELIEEEHGSFFTNETTIEGDCEVAYTIISEQKKTIVTKTINFDKCTQRPDVSYGLRFTSECSECDKDTQVIRPQTVYTYVLENDSLKKAEVRSLYSVNVNGQDVMKTETRSELVLEESHTIKNPIKKVVGEKEGLIYSTRWEELVENFYKNGNSVEFNPFEMFPLEKRMKHIRTLIEKIQEEEHNMPETVHYLAYLVRLFRSASTSDLERIHDALYAKADKKIQSILEHSLAIAGTKNTIEHLLAHIENGDISPLKAAQLLKSIQETPFPSEQIAKAIIKFAQFRVAKTNEVIRQSTWLAAGSVVRGIVDPKSTRSMVREDTRELKHHFLRVFMKQFEDAKTIYEKILALKTIGNAGLDISVYELDNIILDKHQPLPVRKEAIDALRLLKDQMPLKIQKVLLPVYKNRHNKPELRMLALWRIMHTLPEEPLLVQIVSQMEKESNQQVASLTYQMIRQFSQSTNPCYQRLANICTRVLSFTRFQPQEQLMASVYGQLPFFHRDTYSGVQFDFAAVFEKKSFLPKDIHASLDTVFGGNWNKYFAQIGFSQQLLERYMSKIFEYLETLEKETSSSVRGNRPAYETRIKILRELAEKMKVHVGPSDNHKGDAFAMMYFRYKDMDFAVLPIIDSVLLQKLLQDFVMNGMIEFTEIRRLLKQEHEFETHHAAFFYDAIHKFPTTLGLPVVVSGKIPTIFSAEGQLSLDFNKNGLRLNIEARPSVSATHVYEMRMFTPVFEQGVKTLQSVRAFTPFKIEAVAEKKRNFEILLKVTVPENQKSIVSLSTRPVAFLRFPGFSKFEYIEAEERTISLPQWQQKTQEVEKMSQLLGLEISTRGNILNQWTFEDSLLAEQDLEISMETKNRPAEFVARFNVSPFEKATLPQIKLNKMFNDDFELEQGNTQKRRQYFIDMVEELQKEQGYKQMVTLDIEAPRDFNMNSKLISICDKQVRMCQWDIVIRRSPVVEETKEWALRSELQFVRPETPSSLRQLREQPHREVQLWWTANWGSQRKNEISVNAQLQQSNEQKKYEGNLDHQFNGMPEYELLIQAARLNQLAVVSEYKLTPETERQMTRFFNLIKAYNFWTLTASRENNSGNRVVLQVAVDPLSRQFVNVTVQTPTERVEINNVQIPNVHLPSIARRSTKYQISQVFGPVCKVEKNQVRTFDNVIYKMPLTKCYSLVTKDCSENSTFAVFSKKSEKGTLIVKIVRGQQDIIAQLQHNEIRVTVDGETIDSDYFERYQIEQLGESAIVIELPQGDVYFDGYTVKTQIPSYTWNSKNQLSGLCGNNDDEITNEFYTADNLETADIEKFHRSFLLRNDECEVDDELLSEKKNYKKIERDFEEQSSEFIEKTQVKEFSHRVCFSMEPVPECRRGFEIQRQSQRKMRFTCLPRHSNEVRRLMKKYRMNAGSLELENYSTSFVEAVKVPTACVAF